MTDPRMDNYVKGFCEAWERLSAEQKSRLWDVDFKAYWAAIKLTAYRSALDDMQRLEKSRTRLRLRWRLALKARDEARAGVDAALRFADDLDEAARDMRNDYGESLEGQAREYEGMARTLRNDINQALTRK